MIINNTYFKGEIYIAQAQRTITEELSEVGGEVLEFINDYSEECLIKTLGLSLFILLSEELDESNENGLKDSADEKWDWLVNGRSSYTNSKGKISRWKGLRYKSSKADGAKYDRSLIANYVYYFYESNSFIQNTGVGHNINKPKNAEIVSPRFKVVKAWRKYYDMVKGLEIEPNISYKEEMRSVDYFKGNSGDNTLYGFIKDMNELETPLYPEFEEGYIKNINQFDL